MASLFQHQQKYLTERNIDCMWGDWKTTGLLVLQAPIIAGLIAWRFYNVTTPPFLYFALALSSLWFGCTNAARELVKERAIFARERLFGLHMGAYLFAKIKVLCLLGVIQSMLLIFLVNAYVPLKGFLGTYLLIACLTTCAGIGIGLVLSGLVRSIHQADALVPLVLIPQILFSPVVMPSTLLTGWAVQFEKALPLKWSYEAFSEVAKAKAKWSVIGQDTGILLLMIVALFGVTWLLLSQARAKI